MSMVSLPQYLEPVDSHKPTQRIRDPIHGFIHYSLNERKVIDGWIFQRLRRVKQLALTYYVYPGATHTRFEHSLGVMELATRAFDVLLRKHGDKLQAHFQQIPLFEKDTLARARQFVRLFALLHDVGHTAFSHAGEKAIEGGRHEFLSGAIVRENDLLGGMLDEFFFEGIGGPLHDLLTEQYDALQPAFTVIRRLVSGQIDFDRADYLLRDSHHIGVEYGRFDSDRLLESLTIIDDPQFGIDIALEKGGVHMFEALILARYQMNTQVYYHRLRRLFDSFLEKYMELWAPDNYKANDPKSFLMFDDYDLMSQIKSDAQTRDDERGKWAKYIHNRKIFKLILESSDHADAKDLASYRYAFDYLKKKYSDIVFIFDHKSKGNLHKLYVPGAEQEEGKIDDFFVVDSFGKVKRLTDESLIINKIPRTFNTLRIFADIEDEALLVNVLREANEQYTIARR